MKHSYALAPPAKTTANNGAMALSSTVFYVINFLSEAINILFAALTYINFIFKH